MTDADKAYQIAEERIEQAKRSGAKALSLSPHYAEDGKFEGNATPELAALDRIPETIADLTDLQALYLYDTKVEDISPLAAMTGMQRLYLSNTKVEDISPLAAMIGMQTLDLRSTKVEDISHLAAMTGMQTLYLNGTKVEDISPIAAMTGMQTLALSDTQVEDISHLAAMTRMPTLFLSGTKADLGQLVAEGAAWTDEDHALRDLEFRDTPATMKGECLEGIYEAAENNEDRTKAALATLRAERDRRKAEGAEAVEPIEPPEQTSHLKIHITEAGPDIVAAFPDKEEVQNRVKQVCLEQLRSAAAKLALAAGNYHHDLAERARKLEQHLAPDLARIDMLKAHLEIEWLIDHFDTADDLEEEDKPDAKELAALREIKRAGPGLTVGNEEVDELIASQKSRDTDKEPARDDEAEDGVMTSIRDDVGFWGGLAKGVAAFVIGAPDKGASGEARHSLARNAIVAIGGMAIAGIVGTASWELASAGFKAAYEIAPLTGPIFDRALLWLSENASAIRAVAATHGDSFAAWVSLVLDDIRPYVAAIKDHAPRQGVTLKDKP